MCAHDSAEEAEEGARRSERVGAWRGKKANPGDGPHAKRRTRASSGDGVAAVGLFTMSNSDGR